MLGLGEERMEVHQVMDDMRSADIDFMTMGQYLKPTPAAQKVIDFVTPPGVRCLCADRPRQGLPAGRFFAADAVELSCGRRFREDARRTQGPARARQGGLTPHCRGITKRARHAYSAEQMFALVTDIAPPIPISAVGGRAACRADSDHQAVADMIVGFKGLRESFSCRVRAPSTR